MDCAICDGDIQILGVLARTIHCRCRDCGYVSAHTCASVELAQEFLEEVIEQ